MDPESDQSPQSPPGLIIQLKGQHWFVKLVMIGLGAMLGLPFAASFAYAVAGAPGLAAALLLFGGLAIWFLLPSSRAIAPAVPPPPPPVPARMGYCAGCGAYGNLLLPTCSACGFEHGAAPGAASVSFLATVLNDLQAEYRAGRIETYAYNTLARHYESRLDAARRQAGQPVATEAPVPAARPAAEDWLRQVPAATPPAVAPVSPPAPAGPVVPPPPAEPPFSVADAGRAVVGWAAERQADVLLYVGAFLLSVAAIIFVAYQGGAISGMTRFAILTVYAVGFLVLGLLLHRWERVREAGPVFLALGAVLVPIDFVALRTEVTGTSGMPADVGWLLGSTTCAVLYFVLAWRGYGRLYALPGVPAALAAWGALASVLGLPFEWFGPWFEALAAPAYVIVLAFSTRLRFWRWFATFTSIVGAAAIAYTHLAVLDSETASVVLPIVYALATAARGAGLRFRVTIDALILLPLLLPAAVMTAWWSAFGLDPEWTIPFGAAGGLGYLVVAHFTRPEWARNWAGTSIAFVALALVSAHGAVDEGGDAAVLPVTYAFAFAGAAGAYGRWRWVEAAALLPPLAGLAVGTTLWATDSVAVEWYGLCATVVPAGYLLLALFDDAERTAGWRWSAAATAALALGLAHAGAASLPPGDRAALPATYTVVLLAMAAAFLRWRWDWRAAPAALPLLTAMTAATATWASWDPSREWYPPVLTIAVAGYAAVSLFDAAGRARDWLWGAIVSGAFILAFAHLAQALNEPEQSALPLVYAVLLAVAAFSGAKWRLASRETIATVPALAGGFGASAGWALFDMPLEWLPAWVATASAAYLVPASLDAAFSRNWRITALCGGAVALYASHSVAAEAVGAAWQLPVTYALLLVATAWDAYRDRRLTVLAIPLLVSLGGASALWAAGLRPEWWAYPALAAALGMVVAAPLWRHFQHLPALGWAFSLTLAIVATLAMLPAGYVHPGHALFAQAGTAAILLLGAYRSNGTVAALVIPGFASLHRPADRTGLLQSAFAFVFGAAASLNGLLDVEDAGRAVSLAAVAAVAWALTAALGRREREYWTFAPVALVGTAVAAIVAGSDWAMLAAVLAGATLLPLVAYLATRRWTMLGVANSFLFLAVWAGWEQAEANLAWLPVCFAAIALLEWALLAKLRRYTRAPAGAELVIAYLSWGPWLASAAVAGLLLAREQARLAASESLFATEQWALAAAVLAMAAGAVTAEGVRLRLRWVWVAGSAGMLAALLMGIATWEPSNVQAYTAPVGVYLVALSLTFRRSPAIVDPHLRLHEAVMLVGALHLVLPPAEQSFEPGGGVYGLELIGIGLALLLVGLVLHARWLVPASILTLTAVSLRLVTGGMVSVPYWLLLGVAGMALLGFGFLVLLERERWDRFRARVVRWWAEASLPGGPLHPPVSPTDATT